MIEIEKGSKTSKNKDMFSLMIWLRSSRNFEKFYYNGETLKNEKLDTIGIINDMDNTMDLKRRYMDTFNFIIQGGKLLYVWKT